LARRRSARRLSALRPTGFGYCATLRSAPWLHRAPGVPASSGCGSCVSVGRRPTGGCFVLQSPGATALGARPYRRPQGLHKRFTRPTGEFQIHRSRRRTSSGASLYRPPCVTLSVAPFGLGTTVAHHLRYQAHMRLGEDFEFYARALGLGARLLLVPAQGYVSVVRSNSLIHCHTIADLRHLRDCATGLGRMQALFDKDRRALTRFARRIDCPSSMAGAD
jgi:hypothetical protein